MIVRKLIEKIEGEAELDFVFKDDKIDDVSISFGFYRGVEEILAGKDPWDALVITPRVCGICNHAHLLAAVKAIEDGYTKAGINVTLSKKAEAIREFTLMCELVQNHMKWFYITILPQLEKLAGKPSKDNHLLKASYVSSTITKALAIFAGQWPHSSYAVPGGVTCDPTYVDVMQVVNYVDEVIRFFEQIIVGIPLEKYLSISQVSDLGKIKGDLAKTLKMMEAMQMGKRGQSHDRFIVFTDSLFSQAGKASPTTISGVEVEHVAEYMQPNTTAKGVAYKQKLFEVGPLARAMVSKNRLIRSMHKTYKDSLLTRIFARVHETAILLDQCKKVLQGLQLDEPSCTLSSRSRVTDFEGVGLTEAARGSLIHKTKVKEGKIASYEIIVPTQWNLSRGNGVERGIAIEAMVGSSTIEEATLIFRSFDVCSVCTTQ